MSGGTLFDSRGLRLNTWTYSDPLSSDTDRDGIRDSNERRLGTSPTNSDTDGDGATDLQEVQARTDPRKRNPHKPVPSEPLPPADMIAPDTVITTGPPASTAATDAELRFKSTEPDSSLACSIDGGAYEACVSPKVYSDLAAGSHTFSVRATDAAGNKDASPASWVWVVVAPADTIAPDTTISAGPSGSMSLSTAEFSFSSSEAGSSFACSIDGGAYGACVSPKAYSGLAVGSHTFSVRATDAAGNTDATPASRSWTVTSTPSPEPGNVYVSASGSDSAACTQIAPCRTIGRAYRVAEPGDSVLMAAGTYGDTTLPADASKTSPTDVMVKPLPGAVVTMSAELHVTARHLELRDLIFQRRLWVEAGAEDLTIRDADLSTFTVLSNGSQAPRNISLIGGETGPSMDANNVIGSNGTSTSASPRDVLIDGMTFHDFTVTPGSGAHVECLQVWAADGLTIRNSRFRNCEVFDIFLQKLPGGSAATPSNILIENNFMDCCRTGYYAVRMGDHAGTAWSNVTIRNNSMNKPINPDPDVPYSGVRIVGNIGPRVDFYSQSSGSTRPQPVGVTTDYNVWYAGVKVGAHDKVAASGFIDPTALNFHIGALAAAVDAADPADAPLTDIDGDLRPSGGAPDAGADEISGAVPAPPPDTTPPETSVLFGPIGTTTATSVSLAFSSSEVNVNYQCRLDAAGWSSCSSPASYTGLGVGPHTFSVRAIDAAGNVDPTPATRLWTVEPTAPGSDGADLFLSPTGSDSSSCAEAAPCRGFARAYQVAQPGDIVAVAGGTYGSQTIAHDSNKTSASDVTFRPVPGAEVTIGSVTTYASHLTLEDMNATDLTARVTDPPGAYEVTDITFRDMDARNFMVYSATDVSIIGGDYGPASACGGSYGGSNNSIRRYPGAVNPSGILIDGVTIHDIQTYDTGRCHMEGLAVFAGDGVTVRNSKFFRNAIYDVFVQPNSGPVSNLTLENNWFAKSTGGAYSGSGASAVAFSGSSSSFANTLVRHNSFNDILSLDDNGVNPAYSNFQVVGNIGKLPSGGCGEQVTFRFNVWQSQACNTTDRGLAGGALPFANASDAASLDYHLVGGVAQDLVPDSASSTARDIDGDARPMGGARDAGADERA